MKKAVLLVLILFSGAFVIRGAERPKLVVNIVVSGMRYDMLQRFCRNFSPDGFNRFVSQGITCTNAYYSYAQTITPSSLATMTTGANPEINGVVSPYWYNYSSSKKESLIEDPSVLGIDAEAKRGNYSPRKLVVETLGDRLVENYPKSQVITIAANPLSAIVMGGFESKTYWLDTKRLMWTSSTYYCKELPYWVKKYNSKRIDNDYDNFNWDLSRHKESYVNTKKCSSKDGDKKMGFAALVDSSKKSAQQENYLPLLNTPNGNDVVFDFAKQIITYETIGKDDNCDILNICFDTPRYIGELYGPNSLEVEDMYYRFDKSLADFMTFLFAQYKNNQVLMVLTSDHGCSDSYEGSKISRDRFNADQFVAFCNGFLRAKYGDGDWVLGFVNRQLYLNRGLIYQNNIRLEDVQRNLASFCLQVRGVAQAVTSVALTQNYFASGALSKIQHSFFAKRSGDLYIGLLPGWIEEHNYVKAQSGSMYSYDTHVPLMMLGCGMAKKEVTTRVDMCAIAPTLARIIDVSKPMAAETAPIEDVVKEFE